MRRMVLTILMLLMAGAVFVPQARAEIITIAITGVVDSVSDSGNYLGGNIHIGSAISGYYKYESTTLDTSPSDPVQGNYWHYASPAGIWLSVGGFNFQTNVDSVSFRIFIRNNNPSGDDIYGIDSRSNIPLSNGTSVEAMWWQLNNHTATALNSDVLPLKPPVLSQWQENDLRLESSRMFGIIAHVTSAEVVPEPVSILLFGASMLLIRRRSR